MQEFTETIKNWLIDELKTYKDFNEEIEASELAYKITDNINMDGSVYCSRGEAIEFIKDCFEEFGDLVNYCKDNFEMDLNPFNEPEKAEVIAYIEGVNYLLNNSEALKEADQKSEYTTITLTDELIDNIIKELEEDDKEIKF